MSSQPPIESETMIQNPPPALSQDHEFRIQIRASQIVIHFNVDDVSQPDLTA